MEKSKINKDQITKSSKTIPKPPPLAFKKMAPPKFFAPKTFRITQHKGGK